MSEKPEMRMTEVAYQEWARQKIAEFAAENEALREWVTRICNCTSADEMWVYAHLNDPGASHATTN